MCNLYERELVVKNEDDIYKAIVMTQDLLRHTSFNEEDQTLIQLAAEEASTNAFKYCSQDKIIVKWKISLEYLIVEVWQKGQIFSISASQNVNTTSSGRGLPLIIGIMDEVHLAQREGWVGLVLTKNMDATKKEVVEYVN
ncbi:ATP-binding protein [Bacillus tianshenii]|nr:ATP-binding protein [Bacillus tianshenii]